MLNSMKIRILKMDFRDFGAVTFLGRGGGGGGLRETSKGHFSGKNTFVSFPLM